MESGKVSVALVTGAHPYDVVGLQTAFRAMPELDVYPQSLEDYGTDVGGSQSRYDAVVFYNFHQETPAGDAESYVTKGVRRVLEQLGEGPQGIVILHHGLSAFREWSLWDAIIGIEHRYFDWYPDVPIRTDIAVREHPVVAGLSSWEMVEEPYVIPRPDGEVILTTDNPKSGRPLGWVRQYEQARVFCYQQGHDRRAYDDPNWRRVLSRGIQWVARRL